MKAGLIVILITLISFNYLNAQQKCASFRYMQESLSSEYSLKAKMAGVESFIQKEQSIIATSGNRIDGSDPIIIKIPVVVHILYHTQDEKLNDAVVYNQIAILNECFRRKNADTINTPARFRSRAADCEIEFVLATADPKRVATSGITRKYTPIKEWKARDDMKFSSKMGTDAWDTKSYLNIWVCNLDNVAGYSSVMGGPAENDGIVLDFPAFGANENGGAINMGKTAVHEVGHWLSLKHLWGDEFCGDDGIADTPKQAGYNVGCPSGTLISCGNGPDGDMYMNYMDFSNDGCLNMFTQGQKDKMLSLFKPGGPRNSLLTSKGLDIPLIFESPLPEDDPKWLEVKMYPNPATTDLILDFTYDIRWLGKTIQVSNLQGQVLMNVLVTSKNQRIDISRLQKGIYFLAAKKDDGESIKKRFIKL